jgi:3',5'-cyclic AMP phosphodiesterase CpdA
MTRILHISDLHLTTLERTETSLGQLIRDLTREIGISALDAIVVTGDSTDHATTEEYEVAGRFLRELAGSMKVAPNNLLLVPGNHDVSWAASEASYRPVQVTAAPAKTISQYQNPADKDCVEVVTDSVAYQQRFKNFSNYHREVTGRDYSLEYESQFDVVFAVDNSIVLIGLNSAWSIDHFHRERSGIQSWALSRALKAVRESVDSIAPSARIIACWHHPIKGDAHLKDTAFMENLAVEGVVAVLHGHVHKPEEEQFNYEWSERGRRIVVLGAWNA